MRKTMLSDTQLLLKMDKSENVQMFLGGIKNTTLSEREKFIQKRIDKFDRGIIGMLTVVLKTTSEAIGFLNFDINESSNNAELSYIFDFDYWNRGYVLLIENGGSASDAMHIASEFVGSLKIERNAIPAVVLTFN
nr:GNAT family N-acetyltransferase [Clostridium tepidiprofundi]